jgi:hypothetical protein
MKRFLLLCIVPLLLYGCTKEKPVAEVVYALHETSPAAPQYGIEYTNDQTGGTMVTSYSSANYASGKIVLKQGQYVSMKVTCSDPSYNFSLSIFVNGNLWKTGTLNAPGGSVTISGNIPTE